MKTRLSSGALLSVALSMGCNGALDVDLQRMQRQEKVRTWSAAGYFEDGRAMRPVAEGTVARGDEAGRQHEDFQSSVPRLELPGLAAGRSRYDVACSPCHGKTGDGATFVAERMLLRRPPSLVDEPIRSMPDGRLYEVITEGYGLMRPYAEDLPTPAERWSVVGYLRALQLSQATSLDALPAPLRAEAEGRLR